MRRAPIIVYSVVAAFLATHAAPARAQGVEPPAQQFLDRELEPGQAVVRYLFHSGWAVKTQNHFLIFDYTEPLPPPGQPAPLARSIEPAEIADENVTVFISHSHSDHFNPDILKWRPAIKSIHFVWGWEGAGSPEDVHFGRERRTVTDRGLEVLNIYHEGDGIPESAFLVKVDGLTIFHAGDHGSSRGMKDPVFGDNILYLAEQAPRLDLMFTPTFGGEIDAIRALKPRAVFPMHDGGRERQYALFAQKVRGLGLDVQVGAAEKRGALFFYSQGRLTAFPRAVQDRTAPENANEARLNGLQPPGLVMDAIGLAPGMSIAEIGAGKGRYVVHLADRVGSEGKVYAEDIDAEALRFLKDRCQRGGFTNVETILGGETDPKLPAGELDLIFVISSYHHFGDPIALMRNARPALKPTGRVAIAEWVPPKEGRGEGTTPEKMRAQMESAGFALERIDKSLEANRLYIYLFRPVSR